MNVISTYCARMFFLQRWTKKYSKWINLQGKAQSKPVITGATADEGMSYVAGISRDELSDEGYKAIVLLVAKEDYQAVMDKYPPAVNILFNPKIWK